MRVARLAEGLWRWTATHPGGPPREGCDAEVGCVYLETPSAIVLVDPLVPADGPEAERFWTHLDRDVARLGVPLLVVLTADRHRRSADAVAGRYPGTPVVGAAGPVPPEVELIPVPAADEVLVWIPGHAALVSGDVLVGDADGGLRLCPASWLPDGAGEARIRAGLRPVADLPVRMLLVSHGEPVLEEAAAALRGLLG